MRRFAFVLALLAVLVVTPQASAWSWPLRGEVLRPYSLGPDPYAAGQHRGVDVAGSAGETVRAPAAGVVSFVGVVPSSGRTVTIQTDGYAVSLTHLGETTVAKGATVAEGDAVGIAGQSGEVEWPTPYVHLGIRVSSAADGYVDPATLLPPRAVAPPPPPAGEAPVVAPSPAPVVPPVDEPCSGAGDAAERGPAPSPSGRRGSRWPRPRSAAVAPGEPAATASTAPLDGCAGERDQAGWGRGHAQHGRAPPQPCRQRAGRARGSRGRHARLGVHGGSRRVARPSAVLAPATPCVRRARRARRRERRCVHVGVRGDGRRARLSRPRARRSGAGIRARIVAAARVPGSRSRFAAAADAVRPRASVSAGSVARQVRRRAAFAASGAWTRRLPPDRSR